MNDAETVFGPSSVTLHSPVPEQAPLQPANDQPGAGAAVSVTAVPLGNEAVQLEPHSIPGELLVIVPFPVLPTANGKSVGAAARSKMAVTYTEYSISSVHVGAVPSQPPLQPEKTEPGAGVARKTTGVPPVSSAGTDA